MLEKLRRQIARVIAPTPKRGTRMYNAARSSRLTGDFYGTTSSADTELASSLTLLRGRSRSLVRDSGYAKKAKLTIVNNVIGTGIGMQAQVMNERGRLLDKVNGGIEDAWCEWMRAENCHTGGKLHFHDLERQAMGQIFEAGEVLIQKHYTPFGPQGVPFALELIEPERLADNLAQPDQGVRSYYKMGIDRDQYGRALGYYLRRFHPGEIRTMVPSDDQLYRVPGDQMFHLYIVDRWPQTRGEPWLHSAATKLNDMRGLSEAEITAARAAASYMLWVETETGEGPEQDGVDETGAPLIDMSPGIVQYGRPGEKPHFIAPNRPNPNLDPFMRFMLREVASGAMVSYEQVSGDYSQSNFSSSRLGVVDARDSFRAIQQFFIRSFREALHREWLQQAVLAGKVDGVPIAEYTQNRRKFEAVLFKPRGWSYIDPVKDVTAAKEAIAGGMTTLTDVIAEYGNGKDIEDVVKTRRRELDMLEEAKIVTDTDPAIVLAKGESDAAAQAAQAKKQQDDNAAAAARAESAQRDLFEALAGMPAPVVNVAAPVVNIAPQPVYVNTPDVHVDIAPAAVTVEAPIVNVAPPAVTVEAPVVNATVRVPDQRTTELEVIERDEQGFAKRFVKRVA